MSGLHHVTAVTADGDRNRAFYTGVLGLRLVKRTVNHDAPDTWHLYYGGRTGRPGTTITFFVWPDLPRGRPGPGQATAVAFAVPEGSLAFWSDRLSDHGLEVGRGRTAEGRPALAFRDPDGLRLRLVVADEPEGEPPGVDAPVSGEHAVRGFHGVTLAVEQAAPTVSVLEDVLGFRRHDDGAPADDAATARLVAEGAGPGRRVEVVARPDGPEGRRGAGTVHHVAFRAADRERQEAIRAALRERGLTPSPPVDRYYFRSIYVREPGGVLLEVATDGPGFTRDEGPESLGSSLALPPWLEDRREEIEAGLPPLAGDA